MIRSRQNQKLKDIRRLRRSKGSRALLEGPHLVEEAIAAAIPIELILATPDFAASSAGIELATKAGRDPTLVEARLLDELTDSDSPRGVLAVGEIPRGDLGSIPARQDVVLVYADGLQDPGNLGALARVAEAAGAGGLLLAPGSVHPNHPRALRASAGSLLRLPVALSCRVQDLDNHLLSARPTWIALVPRGGFAPWSQSVTGAVVLALGAEGPGLSKAVRERCTLSWTIPLAAPVESLNSTVAAAIALFELRRRRIAPSAETRRA